MVVVTWMKKPGFRVLMFALTVCGFLVLPGCQGGNSFVPVAGQVLVDGEPAAKAIVVLHPVDGKSPVKPTGHTDDQGRFRLTSRVQGDGAPPGEYRVTVLWFLASELENSTDESVARNQLPAHYASPENSGLRATITVGANELQPFNLTVN